MRISDTTGDGAAAEPGHATGPPPAGESAGVRRRRLLPDRWRRRAVPGVPALAALLCGLWGIRRGSMWQDEATTYAVAGRALPDLWRTLGNVDAVHGFYYLLIHPLAEFAGGVLPAEVLIRLPSVLAAAAASAGVAPWPWRRTRSPC